MKPFIHVGVAFDLRQRASVQLSFFTALKQSKIRHKNHRIADASSPKNEIYCSIIKHRTIFYETRVIIKLCCRSLCTSFVCILELIMNAEGGGEECFCHVEFE